MTCEFCKRDKPIVAKGLCNACYQRRQKTGSLEYKQRAAATCSVADCKEPADARGLCTKHYQRWHNHGHTETVRPDSWGSRSKHPLGNAWKWLIRKAGMVNIAPEWQNDFLQFAMDVGERPSLKHKLFAADEARPIGPDNFVWKEAFTQRVEGEDDLTFQARRQRAYRKFRTEAYKGYDTKRHYGITHEDFQVILDRQNHKCPICDRPETMKINGKVIALSVDHDHATGKVRGALCNTCNRGLGNLGDNVDNLRRAIAYLDRHAEPPIGADLDWTIPPPRPPSGLICEEVVKDSPPTS